MIMKKENLFIILGILLITLPLASALTASISNPRMVLYKNITQGEILKVENTVGVINDNDYDVEILITPADDWKDKFTLDESEFILKQGEKKEVSYTISLTESGHFKGDILVTFQEKGSEIKLSAAQDLEIFVNEIEKSPSITGASIEGIEGSSFGIMGIISIVVLAILLFTLIKFNKKQK
jgi:hypothetical protein